MHDCYIDKEPAGTGQYGRILNTNTVGITKFMLDADLSLLWADDGYYRQTGYSEQEYKEKFKNLRQHYAGYPGDFEFIDDSLAGALKNGGSGIEMEVRMPVKGGGFVWKNISASISSETVNEHPVCYITYTDAVQKNAADKCRQCPKDKIQYFKWMMDEYEGNIYISDMETYELLYFNPTACESVGRKLNEVLGEKCYEVIQGRTSPCPYCTNDKLREDEVYEWEFYNQNLDRAFMIKDRIIEWEGKKVRLELSHDNYSLEYRLAKKDRERDAIFRTIPGALARIDARDMDTVLWYGAKFLDVIGYTKEQFENELHSKRNYVYPEDRERAVKIMKKLKETDEYAIMDTRFITHSGETRFVTVTFSYVRAEESWDGIPSFYSVGLDITKERLEQQRQRKILEEAYQMTKIASEAKTNFLSSMSHDIRTPMNAIIGMTSIAAANLNSPGKVENCLNKISSSSTHLLGLINEILDMSKIESGKIDLMYEEVDLPKLFQEIMDMCQPLFYAKNQEFHISANGVRHEKIITDGERLKQVLMNLLSNAIKYTPEGGEISLRINELYSPLINKSQYEFCVTDNGIGMSEDFLSHIFEPFSRAEDSRISKIQGTGLGMTISENIVQMMNGTIDVQSSPGNGSRFTVSVPLEWRAQQDDAADNKLTGLPVLVVDDDQMVCENTTAILEELGMRGSWVLSGREAIEKILAANEQADDFFAVILDWKMPDMDGLQIVRNIRQKLKQNIPIIIISAYDYSDIKDGFLDAGADAFITKPLFKSKILHILQTFITEGRNVKAHAEIPSKPDHIQGKRLLLVEDNELNREVAAELLEMQNFAIDSAENGKKAVEKFQASAPGTYAGILMDIQMPVMNGYEATSAIRALPREDAQAIPIIALTANAFAVDITKARSAGMNDHVAKPIEVDRLTEILKKWIN